MKKMLDIGCGPGTINNLGYYRKYAHTYEIYGIDFLKKNITTIKQRFPQGHFSVADAQELPYPKNTFDSLISRHVLEHVHDATKVVKEMNRVSKKGADLIIAVPHHKLEDILVGMMPHYMEGGHHHERMFTEKEIVLLLKKNGYKIVSVKNQKWPMFVIVISLAVLSKYTKKITMEEQSGIFTLNKKNYLKNKKMYRSYDIVFNLLMFLNSALGFLNYVIPFEIEIYAKKT
jgi:2-polyprenyl-3-methyl-5-hydroxy-6-metoxy-1,4-benzoquinol methylase